MTNTELETCPNDWCDKNGPVVEDEGQCAVCLAKEREAAEYWAKRYYASYRPTPEEVDDAYSDPSENSKRVGLRRMLGYE